MNVEGPTLPISKEIHALKYRGEGETFREAMTRVANALSDSPEHFNSFRDILLQQKFLPAGRIQASVGSPRTTTPYNCFVSGVIEDSMSDIMSRLGEAAETMRLGGGIGYDFSTLRPRGALIKSLDSRSSGVLGFMDVYNALCGCISSAGHRRGAQMGTLRVDHPDIEEFITSKTNTTRLNHFNISVGITDLFMKAVNESLPFDLIFDGMVYKTIDAQALWDKILRCTWDWAEPGVLFLDTINKKNNLHMIEDITTTNPCGEQPLPPFGACLLGSFNLVKYIRMGPLNLNYFFDLEALRRDIPQVVRAMDNVIDIATYPLEMQELEAKNKRRMGLGVTGLANALEILGLPYASQGFLDKTEDIMICLRDGSYEASIELAKEKGPFPLFNPDTYGGSFYERLPSHIIDGVIEYGIRNSHLLSIAPTGTISLSADNVSSGIEPIFSPYYDRVVQTYDGPVTERISDYAFREYGVAGVTANELDVMDHVNVLTLVSKYVDSACSKTCNVGPDVPWSDFKGIYEKVYKEGGSGCTTFRASGKRAGILTASKDEELADEGTACYIDTQTGRKTCE